MSSDEILRTTLSVLLISLPPEKVYGKDFSEGTYHFLVEEAQKILQGKSTTLLYNRDDLSLNKEKNKKILSKFPSDSLRCIVNDYVNSIYEGVASESSHEDSFLKMHLLAIALLQSFIQLNFTGPSIEHSYQKSLFPNIEGNYLQAEINKLLNVEGQQAYDLMVDPILLVLSCIIFEKLLGISGELSIIGSNGSLGYDKTITAMEQTVEKASNNPVLASTCWWYSRALQVQGSVVSEMPGIISKLSSILLNPSIITSLFVEDQAGIVLRQHIELIFSLEYARVAIHGQTENYASKFIHNARRISGLELVLTGAKAKKTRFQDFYASILVLLAKSQMKSLYTSGNELPETFNLNSDYLLEMPEYESLTDVELQNGPEAKKIKKENFFESPDYDERLIPLATKTEDIPINLRNIEPNNQEPLDDLDNLQLLLIFTILKQTTPINDVLVEEELFAILERILSVKHAHVNWSIFSRALWERSVLETGKPKTVERGILQMTSIIEEIGIKIRTKVIPGSGAQEESQSANRLRFVHQLPLIPQWTMDVKLAEKYMSLGVLKSALEIYERLQFASEAALCYAATGDEQQAERVISSRLEKHPDDARAISILGDIKQDPNLWLKAWEVGKYPKAKATLSRYLYNPPRNCGINRNVDLAIKHMNDSLCVNPLNFENWFFYGCCGLETEQYDLASEAFTRCLALDDSNAFAAANLASSFIKLGKLKQALISLQRAIRNAGDSGVLLKLYDNYLTVAYQLESWNDVLIAMREIVKVQSNSAGERAIDLPMLESLVDVLTSTEYMSEHLGRVPHFQSSCTDLVCNILPKVITKSSRCWRIVSRVELWRKRPWAALECHEKAYRALLTDPNLEFDEKVWNDAVESCSDLVAAYESLGELPGKYGTGELVCKDWKYKAKSVVRSLASKGKASWEDTDGWNALQSMKEELLSA